METMILTFVVLSLIVVGMAVGVLMGRKPIAGSCGGMTALGMDVACDVCKGDPDVCETEQQKTIKADKMVSDSVADISYDASR
ncbi:MAG: (Na+)-NQR maturation NqrM [Gammaproteobacteria bacterium]|nr:(Na+)-NQR maturation NqrM [Gammaproteobacteria bacterium]